ncbi:S-adenosyl methyltransferase [Micromonospora pallida]|uniref:S-adenosyl methyltransferase n=1 Tax=Micromonospora pallida TaxID=145854 RepID=A0A1C6RY60_9ACTN|nr:SAM-dependent methyltransferase [Micromonospora pallida]SCL21961.1 S-adenosyl methyltransferase [Micromonospora pallida]
MERPDWAPDDVDLTRPSVARAYDYWLGGSHNFEVDREFARQAMAAVPGLRMVARANREFLHRAVRFMLDQGVRQFLDIGSGIPTVGNVHEIAQQVDSDARVVYVDIDPVAVAHSTQILAGQPNAVALLEDLRHPEAILDHPETRRLLDLDRPVGLLLVSVVHAIPDEDDPWGLVRRLWTALAPGSCVAISHVTTDSRPDEMGEGARLSSRTSTPVTARPRARVEDLFAGLDLVEPGVVWSPLWRPENPADVGENPEQMSFYVGVGCRR